MRGKSSVGILASRIPWYGADMSDATRHIQEAGGWPFGDDSAMHRLLLAVWVAFMPHLIWSAERKGHCMGRDQNGNGNRGVDGIQLATVDHRYSYVGFSPDGGSGDGAELSRLRGEIHRLGGHNPTDGALVEMMRKRNGSTSAAKKLIPRDLTCREITEPNGKYEIGLPVSFASGFAFRTGKWERRTTR